MTIIADAAADLAHDHRRRDHPGPGADGDVHRRHLDRGAAAGRRAVDVLGHGLLRRRTAARRSPAPPRAGTSPKARRPSSTRTCCWPTPMPPTATATVQFLTEYDGVVTRTVTLPPTSRTNVVAGGIPELAGKSFSIVVDATLPIIAERAMYFGPGWKGGHESIGRHRAGRRRGSSPRGRRGCSRSGCWSGNPNDTPAHVTLTYLLETGQVIVRDRDMAPEQPPDRVRAGRGGRTRERRDLDDGDVGRAGHRGARDVLARAADWGEAHNSFGVTETATKWGLAEGRVGGPHPLRHLHPAGQPNARRRPTCASRTCGPTAPRS